MHWDNSLHPPMTMQELNSRFLPFLFHDHFHKRLFPYVESDARYKYCLRIMALAIYSWIEELNIMIVLEWFLSCYWMVQQVMKTTKKKTCRLEEVVCFMHYFTRFQPQCNLHRAFRDKEHDPCPFLFQQNVWMWSCKVKWSFQWQSATLGHRLLGHFGALRTSFEHRLPPWFMRGRARGKESLVEILLTKSSSCLLCHEMNFPK